MQIITFLLVAIVFGFFAVIYFVLSTREVNDTICNKRLTDKEYIEHMISHHEVAVSMSEAHLNHTRNPLISNILRNVIRIQNYEINMMKDMMYKIDHVLNDDMSTNTVKMNYLFYAT